MELSRICYITNPHGIGGSTADVLIRLFESGIRFVQYRAKDMSRGEIYQEALSLRAITRDFGAAFIVNDYPDIALMVDADGVHLGQEDMPLSLARRLMGKKIIGISTHNIDEARAAEAGGADYIGFGPVFHTDTKTIDAPKGLLMLKEIVDAVSIAVFAIGGIKADNLGDVCGTGCYGVAVSSGLAQGNIEANASKFVTLFNSR